MINDALVRLSFTVISNSITSCNIFLSGDVFFLIMYIICLKNVRTIFGILGKSNIRVYMVIFMQSYLMNFM